MNEFTSEFSGLEDEDITKVLDLLGADFWDAGKIYGVSFFDSDGVPVKIINENHAGFVDKIDVELLAISNFRNEIKNNI